MTLPLDRAEALPCWNHRHEHTVGVDRDYKMDTDDSSSCACVCVLGSSQTGQEVPLYRMRDGGHDRSLYHRNQFNVNHSGAHPFIHPS